MVRLDIDAFVEHEANVEEEGVAVVFRVLQAHAVAQDFEAKRVPDRRVGSNEPQETSQESTTMNLHGDDFVAQLGSRDHEVRDVIELLVGDQPGQSRPQAFSQIVEDTATYPVGD
jgi:hypothetical protein